MRIGRRQRGITKNSERNKHRRKVGKKDKRRDKT